MKLMNFEHSEDLFSWAAHNFVEMGKAACAKNPFFNVALSGGKTAQSFFATLREEGGISSLMAKTRFFTSDERAVDLNSPQSNAGNAWRELLQPLSVSPTNFFPMFDEKHTPAEAATIYQQKLFELLPQNANKIPVFDVIYLGLGEDGHTASLFPHSKLLSDLNDQDLVKASVDAPAGFVRITFMPSLILAAKHISIMVTGANKAGILDDVLHGPLMPEQWPAQYILRAKHPNLTLLTAL
jgi:6-phosphogluconolactonase